MRLAFLPSLCLTLAIASCSSEPKSHPGVLSNDTGATSFLDLGVTGQDVVAVGDAPPAMDADATDVTIADTGAIADTGTTADAGSVTDAVAVTDAGTATDTGASADTGAVVDVGASDTGGGDAGVCGAGRANCNADGGVPICVDLRVDTLHCGACGVRCCGTFDRCTAGVCTASCPTLQTSCRVTAATDAGCVETRCVDTSVDDLNCGACGHACPDGKGCVSGTCI